MKLKSNIEWITLINDECVFTSKCNKKTATKGLMADKKETIAD